MQDNKDSNNDTYIAYGLLKTENEEIINKLNKNDNVYQPKKMSEESSNTNMKKSNNIKKTVAITLIIIDYLIIGFIIITFIAFLLFLQIPMFIAVLLGANLKETVTFTLQIVLAVFEYCIPVIILVLINLLWANKQV